MTPILPTITEAGLAAVFNQTSTGFAAEITHIAVGDRGYAPTQTQEALHHEVARFPIADGVMATPTQAHLTALDDTDREYWVREVGFYLSDGTLFAVYSHPTNPLAYKTAGNDFLHAYDLILTAVPEGSVVVNSTGARLTLIYAEELAMFAQAIVASATRELALLDRVSALERVCADLQNTTLRVHKTTLTLSDSTTSLTLRADDTTEAVAAVAAMATKVGGLVVNPLLT